MAIPKAGNQHAKLVSNAGFKDEPKGWSTTAKVGLVALVFIALTLGVLITMNATVGISMAGLGKAWTALSQKFPLFKPALLYVVAPGVVIVALGALGCKILSKKEVLPPPPEDLQQRFVWPHPRDAYLAKLGIHLKPTQP